MRPPTPRLRQVFEHATHFKVARPGQNPLMIAKQGLSPGLHARLRAFARGGAPDAPVDEDILSSRASLASTEPVETVIEQPVTAQSQNVMPAPGTAVPEYVPSSRSLSFEPEVVAAPQDRTVKVLRPLPRAPTLEEIRQHPAFVSEEVVQPGPVALPKATLLDGQGLVAPTISAAPVAVTPVAVAPPPVAVKPAEVVVPAAVPVKPEIKLPEGVTEASPEAFKKAMDLNPKAEPHDVANALIAKINPELPPIELKIERPEGLEGKPLERFDDAVARKASALTQQAQVDLDEKKDLLRIADQARARALEAADKDRQVAERLGKRKDALQQYVDAGFKPESFWGRLSTPQKIGSTLALAIGGFLSGSTKTPNYVYEAFNKAIDNDLEVQVKNHNSILSQYNRVLGDADAAEKLTRADLMNLSAMEVKSAQARADLKGIAPQLARLGAEMDMEAAKLREDVRKKMAEADIAAAQAETELALREAKTKKAGYIPPVRPAAASVSAERLAFAKAKYEAGKKFSIPDPADPARSIFINASSEQTAKRIIPEIQQRVDGVMRLEDFVDWLKQNQNKPVTPEAVKQMQTKIAGIVENYPGIAKGSKSLVTVAQSKLLKPAITSTEIPIIQFMDVLGLTSTAMQEIKNDATRGVMTSIKAAAAEDDPGAKEFLSKWTPQGYRGKTGYGAPSAAAVVSAAPPGYTRMKKPDGSLVNVPTANVAKAKTAPYNYVEVP